LTDGCRVACLTVDQAGAEAEDWADLDRRCLEPNAFNTPAFALSAARFIPGRRPRVLTARDDASGRLIGLCLVTPGLPGWPLAAWLHPQAVAAIPLLDRSDGPRALAAMLRWAEARLYPGLVLHGVPADGPTMALLAGGRWAVRRLEERRRAVLPGGATETGLTGKAAKEFRRQARRLADQGALAYRVSHTPEAVAADLDDFLVLESTGWKGRRGTALTQSPGLRSFVQTMIAGMAANGRCAVHRLDLDGHAIAMGIVLRHGTTASFWKTAFDESRARFSPGVRLTEALSRHQAAEAGLDRTDSCAVQDHPMIDRLWPDRLTVVDVLIGPEAGSSRLAAYATAERARRAVRQQIKALAGPLFRRPG
jgi:CelD/BcsL family acetyltransferase involved in cellulose biosynthesis